MGDNALSKKTEALKLEGQDMISELMMENQKRNSIQFWPLISKKALNLKAT